MLHHSQSLRLLGRLSLLLLSALWCGATFRALPGQSLPLGFVDELVEPGGFATALRQLPDGRFLIAEKDSGDIVLSNGTTRAAIGHLANVDSTGARGLLGMAIDPGWPQRPYIYLSYTDRAAGDGRLVRLTASGALQDGMSLAVSLGDLYVILDGIPDQSILHNVAALAFDAQGQLLMGVGDDAQPCEAQRLDSLLGRVLRIDVSGLPAGAGGPPTRASLVPPGNPFAGPSDAARLTWCLGLRHPFSFEVDLQSGALLIADVGDATIEEVNVSAAGGENFGWPWFEGSGSSTGACAAPSPVGVRAPDYFWDRRFLPPAGASAMSFVLYRNPAPGAPFAFGPSYEGSYFVSDYFHGFVRRLERSGNAWGLAPAAPGQPAPDNWAQGLPSMTDAIVGQDGAIYYLRATELRRIRPSMQLGVVAITGGQSQVATPDVPLLAPLEVQVRDVLGAPVAGVPVQFSDLSGTGVLGAQPVLTDALGMARTSYRPGIANAATVTIEARSPGYATASFQVLWRGLIVRLSGVVPPPPFVGAIQLDLLHSATDSPFTLVIQAAIPPALPTPYGTVRTSILGLVPRPDMLIFDGLGLVFAPDPAMRTGMLIPTWTSLLPVPAGLSGATFQLQAYAIDPALLPAANGVLISNAFTLNIP